jgi:hypothetical protein
MGVEGSDRERGYWAILYHMSVSGERLGGSGVRF